MKYNNMHALSSEINQKSLFQISSILHLLMIQLSKYTIYVIKKK